MEFHATHEVSHGSLFLLSIVLLIDDGVLLFCLLHKKQLFLLIEALLVNRLLVLYLPMELILLQVRLLLIAHRGIDVLTLLEHQRGGRRTSDGVIDHLIVCLGEKGYLLRCHIRELTLTQFNSHRCLVDILISLCVQ